jgi:ABC-2 type transport system ATP-binding protein
MTRPITSPTAPARLAVEVRGLRVSFGKQLVLDGIDLRVPAGSVFALLGPNGAGKTTVVHVLATLLRPDAGEVLVGGFDTVRQAGEVRRRIGLTGQVSAVDPQFTGEENLRLMADLHHLGATRGRARVAELLERFDLGEAARKPVQTWSGGMRRRLDLAMTLVGEPSIVFLDEPTTGLDPRSRRALWDMVRDLAASGVTVFLTTQYLEEADRLAARIAILDHGRVVAEGTPAELKRLVPGGSVRFEFESEAALDRAAAILPRGTRDEGALALEVPDDGGVHGLRSLLDRLDEASLNVAGLSVRSADLDDVFLSMTGRPGEGDGATSAGLSAGGEVTR